MSYAAFDDVIKTWKPVQTIIGSADSDVTTLDVSSVHIWASEGIVDAYLANKYVTPVAPVPSIITAITCDLTLHRIFAEKSAQVPEWMDKRYDRAIKLLECLRDGEMVLPGVSGVGSLGENFAWSTTQDYHPVFSPVLDDIDQAPDQQRIDADQAAILQDW